MKQTLERLALLVLALAPSLACGREPEPEVLPPNLLFISIDTLRTDALGAYGGSWQASPFLDRMAAAGLVFESSWSHTPKTAPSHMSMFTGLPPRVHGVGNQRSSGTQRLSDDITTLAEALSSVGYRTSAVTSGGNVKGYLGFERGFERYEDKPGMLRAKLAEASAWIHKVAGHESASAARPWFFFFHTYAVHDPYLTTAEDRARFVDPDYSGEILSDAAQLKAAMRDDDRAPWASSHQKLTENFWARADLEDPADLEHLHQLYMAGVAELDRELERSLGELEAAGLLDNTIIVLTSDHGEEFGEHGKTRHEQLWQELLHVPLLVHLPGDELTEPSGPDAGRIVHGVVRHMDLVPSLLELMGLEPAELFHQELLGESWAPWIADASLEDPGRPVLSEHRSKLGRPLDLWALRHSGELLILPEPEAAASYVDRREDPLELSPSPAASLDAALPLFALRATELGRFQKAAMRYGAGAGIELDPETRAELEGLGYL